MKQYLDLCSHVLEKGFSKNDRTGTGTLSTFGYQMRFDFSQGFPLLTTKKIFWKGVVSELLWMISGDTNIEQLTKNNVHIWDEWADKKGNLGRIYGYQWRHWKNGRSNPIDQLKQVVKDIQDNPDSRRLIVSAWNVGDLNKMSLPPCHLLFQFYVVDGKLSCQLYQRSADIFLGVPFNIASYSLLTMMVAQVTGLKPGEFIHTLGDAHIYKNHIEQIKIQLERSTLDLPTVELNPEIKNLFDFKASDITLKNYNPHPSLKGEVAV